MAATGSRTALRLFYENVLKREIAALEPLRRRARLAIMSFTGACVAAPLLAIPFLGAETGLVTAVVILCLFFPAVKALGGYVHRDFRERFKQRIIERLVAFVNPDLEYQSDAYLPRIVYGDSDIFHLPVDSYDGDDLVQGMIGKTRIAFSELHVKAKTEYGGDEPVFATSHTIFKGLFFVGDFNKHFRGRTYVFPDRTRTLSGFLAAKLRTLQKSHGGAIRLEDPEFERLFEVYGTDPLAARYVLTTSLMKRIARFKAKTRRPVYLSFIGSRVYVAIRHRRDRFEPSLFQSGTDFAQIDRYVADLQLCTGIVEDLDLNTRIWTKE